MFQAIQTLFSPFAEPVAGCIDLDAPPSFAALGVPPSYAPCVEHEVVSWDYKTDSWLVKCADGGTYEQKNGGPMAYSPPDGSAPFPVDFSVAAGCAAAGLQYNAAKVKCINTPAYCQSEGKVLNVSTGDCETMLVTPTTDKKPSDCGPDEAFNVATHQCDPIMEEAKAPSKQLGVLNKLEELANKGTKTKSAKVDNLPAGQPVTATTATTPAPPPPNNPWLYALGAGAVGVAGWGAWKLLGKRKKTAKR